MAIYFARHGQTELGSQDRLEGVSSSELTQRGKEQAERLGMFLKSKKISKLISSPLKRSCQTASIVSKVIGVGLDVNEIWKEMSYGKWDGQRKEKLRSLPEWKKRRENKYSFVHPGHKDDIPGESYAILSSRLKSEFIKISDNFSEINIVIIAHTGILRSVKNFFNNLTPEETVQYKPLNNELIKLTSNNNEIKVELIKY